MRKILFTIVFVACSLFAKGAEYDQFMGELTAQAKKENSAFNGFSKDRGEKIFLAVQKDKNGENINCATCHQNDIRKSGKNPTTGKAIEPLAPSVVTTRLTQKAEMQKWLKRNFKQVYGREGTAIEKGDVLEYISSK